uniref:VPS11, CORVET/HOPS core subunit n=1 Tax=Mus musculus TaxID=10090 RepID=A0A1L1SQ62_MOUSE
MAAYLQWRRFVFFEKELVKEPLAYRVPGLQTTGDTLISAEAAQYSGIGW